MAIVAFRLNIRNRVVILALIITIALISQTVINSEATNLLLTINGKGEEHKASDSKLNIELLGLNSHGQEFINYIQEDISNTIETRTIKDTYNGINQFSGLIDYIAQVGSDLDHRELGSYSFGAIKDSILLSAEESTILLNMENIIDTQVASSVRGQIIILDNIIRTSLELEIKGYNNLREIFVENIDGHKDITNNIFYLSQLFGGNASILYKQILIGTNDTYHDEQIPKLLNLNGNFSQLSGILQIIELSWNTLDPASQEFNNIVTSFENATTYIFAGIQNVLSDLNGTLDLQDQILLDKIDHVLFLGDNNLKTVFDDYFTNNEAMLNNHISIVEVKYNLNGFFDTISIKIDRARFLLEEEMKNFNSLFSDLQESIEARFSIITNYTNILIVAFVILTLFPTVFSLRTKLARLDRKQKKLAMGKIGELAQETKKKYGSDEIDQITKSFDEMITNLKNILIEVLSTSHRLSGISEMLAAGAEEASASISSVSDTMNTIATGASKQNSLLSNVLNRLNEHLNIVNEASVEINETAYFVLKVAQRTNLLGLNASIESAKAGKYGKGFGIVASEVRALSNETKASANKIGRIIDNINFNIKKDVEEILSEVDIIKDVSENTTSISREADISTTEQANLFSEIADSSNQLAGLAIRLEELLQGFEL